MSDNALTPRRDLAQAPRSTEKLPSAETPFRRFLRQYSASPVAVAAVAVLTLLSVVAIGCRWIAPQDPYDLAVVSILDGELPPGSLSADETMRYVLGTDGAGRDLVSAILYGLRISVGVGAFSALIAMLFGTSIGLISAHFGGRADSFLMRVVDIQLSFPTILVALVLLAVLGQGVDKTLLALVIVQWAFYARNVRGCALVEREKEYIEAALGQALPAWRIMFLHILPNCMPTLLVTATLQTAHAITLEATMSFLGIGLPQTEPSLGRLISNGFEYMLTNKYWISLFPGIALVLLVASINLIGDRLRAVLNPKLEA